MQTKISKTLEGLIARTAFDTSKQGETRWLKDRLLLEIVREEGSLAYQLLSARLKGLGTISGSPAHRTRFAGAYRRPGRKSRRVLRAVRERVAQTLSYCSQRLYGPRLTCHHQRRADDRRARIGNVPHHAGRRRRRNPPHERGRRTARRAAVRLLDSPSRDSGPPKAAGCSTSSA